MLVGGRVATSGWDGAAEADAKRAMIQKNASWTWACLGWHPRCLR